MRLEEFSYVVTYKKGISNTNADVLSRIQTEPMEEVAAVSLDLVEQKIEIEDVKLWQREDEEVCKLRLEVESKGGRHRNFVVNFVCNQAKAEAIRTARRKEASHSRKTQGNGTHSLSRRFEWSTSRRKKNMGQSSK